ILRNGWNLDTGWRITGIKIRAAHPFLSPRQELQHDAAGAPTMSDALGAGLQFLSEREAHAGRNLLGSTKILMGGVFEITAFERHQALIAAHVGALVDGHGEVAPSDKGVRGGAACRERGVDRGGVVTRHGPDPT